MESEPAPEPKPWEGRKLSYYPPTEIRRDIQESVVKALDEHMIHNSRGLVASELASTVAQKAFDEFGVEETPYLLDDVKIEMARMNGTLLRIAPNNELFVDDFYRQKFLSS